MADHPTMVEAAKTRRGGEAVTGPVPWPIELDAEAVRLRFRAARRSGRPRYLWPETEPEDWRRGLREIERVVRQVLTGASATLGGDPRALGVAAFTSGTGPLLGSWVEAGLLTADQTAAALLGLHLHHGRERARRQRRTLIDAVAAFAEADIEPIVLKSAATATLYFEEAGVRPGVDIDLVVRPSGYDHAERVLAGLGHAPVGRQISPRKSDWRVRGTDAWPRSLELMHSGAQYGIDLHESLGRDFFGIRRVTVPADTVRIDTAGASLRVLSQPGRLAFHALHASEGLDNLTLIRLIEIVLMARRDAGRTFEWVDLVAMLRSIGGLRFAWPAFMLAEKLAPGTIDAQALETMRDAATPAMRRVLDGLAPADAQRLDVLTLRERFMWCAGPVEHVRRFAHMLLPAPAGRSPARLASLYIDRLWRLVRGNVEVSRPDRDS